MAGPFPRAVKVGALDQARVSRGKAPISPDDHWSLLECDQSRDFCCCYRQHWGEPLEARSWYLPSISRNWNACVADDFDDDHRVMQPFCRREPPVSPNEVQLFNSSLRAGMEKSYRFHAQYYYLR